MDVLPNGNLFQILFSKLQISLNSQLKIPWEHFNDLQKRLIYSLEDPVYIAENKKIADWRDAGNHVKYEGQFDFLKAQGLKPVELIVAMLGRDDLSRERKDALADLAARLLLWYCINSDKEPAIAKSVLSILESYIDHMEDKGAFSKRYYAILAMRGYYDKIGIDGFLFKQGWAPTDRHFKFYNIEQIKEIATNALSLSRSVVDNKDNQTKKAQSLEDEKQLKTKSKFLAVCVSIVVLCLLGAGLARYWKLTTQKPKNKR